DRELQMITRIPRTGTEVDLLYLVGILVPGRDCVHRERSTVSQSDQRQVAAAVVAAAAAGDPIRVEAVDPANGVGNRLAHGTEVAGVIEIAAPMIGHRHAIDRDREG